MIFAEIAAWIFQGVKLFASVPLEFPAIQPGMENEMANHELVSVFQTTEEK